MNDITFVEFIWNISLKFSEWYCSIKLKDVLFVIGLYLFWKLCSYIVFYGIRR